MIIREVFWLFLQLVSVNLWKAKFPECAIDDGKLTEESPLANTFGLEDDFYYTADSTYKRFQLTKKNYVFRKILIKSERENEYFLNAISGYKRISKSNILIEFVDCFYDLRSRQLFIQTKPYKTTLKMSFMKGIMRHKLMTNDSTRYRTYIEMFRIMIWLNKNGFTLDSIRTDDFLFIDALETNMVLANVDTLVDVKQIIENFENQNTSSKVIQDKTNSIHNSTMVKLCDLISKMELIRFKEMDARIEAFETDLDSKTSLLFYDSLLAGRVQLLKTALGYNPFNPDSNILATLIVCIDPQYNRSKKMQDILEHIQKVKLSEEE